jgi:hypothetical protein
VQREPRTGLGTCFTYLSWGRPRECE